MPILSLREVFGREYGDDAQNSHAVRVFRVTMSAPTYFISDVMDDPAMPPLGQVYLPVDHEDLRCVSREITEVGRSMTEFEVTFRYDRFPFNRWDIKLTNQTVEKVLEKTLEDSTGPARPLRFVDHPATYLETQPVGALGENVLNRAKCPLDPPVMQQRTQIVIHADIMVNELTDIHPYLTSIGELQFLVGKVNKVKIQICSLPDETGAGCDYWTLLLEEAAVTKIETPWGCSYQLSLRIVYDPDAHCAVVLNAGYQELVDPGDPTEKLRQIRVAGKDATTPIPLDETGVAIDPADLPGMETYLIAPNYATADFSVLNLPTTFCGDPPSPIPPTP
jgi:hypothetical protein